MFFKRVTLLSCAVVLFVCLSDPASSQGTAKVQEFFKKYFGEYFPKTTRSYTLYGNGLNGPADFQASLPVSEDRQGGPIKSIIIRQPSPSRQNSQQGPAQNRASSFFPISDNSWQPTNFDPVAFARGGHRGRSDVTEEFDDTESRIITAEDAEQQLGAAGGTREFRIESSMSFNGPPSGSPVSTKGQVLN